MRARLNSTAGFSLLELVIVLGLIGVLMGGAWTLATQSRQNVHLQQSVDALAYTVDSARAGFVGQSAISGGIGQVMPALLARQALPQKELRSTSSSCGGATSNFVDAPIAATATDPCGTFRVCAWNYAGGQTACAVSGTPASQYLGIEFSALTYDACVALAMRVSPTSPPGLVDVYVNGNSSQANGVFPVTFEWVTSASSSKGCTKGVSTNTVSYIYRLRTPVY